jgi:Zn-finger nucleic acid-binding protein
MKCPACTSADLLMSERQGIEIDYCPQCRGVWLDRGELDKIIERSAAETAPPAAAPARQSRPQQPQQPYGDQDDDYYKRKRRRSFLEDLFD